jgi:hypothetical protein
VTRQTLPDASEAARAVAIDVTAMLADVAAQLLALLRREASGAALLSVALERAALEFLAPHLALLLEALEAALPVTRLGLGGQAGHEGQESTCKGDNVFHCFNPASSGALDVPAQKRRSASCRSR